MLEVADILRRHGCAYRAQHTLLPSQQKVFEDLVRCRTAACGGQLYRCDHCGSEHYSYHSCGNRHCPKCHGQQTQRWLEKQQRRLLPCAYYLLTFTLPAELRSLARSHQKAAYSLLMSSAAAALQKLAWDPRYIGAQLGVLGVLHTWTRALLYHPHVHLLVTAGGLSRDGQHWVSPKNPAFLVPGYALSKIFRGKFRAGLRKLKLLDQVPSVVWKAPWVVHAQHAGRGDKVLQYLGRYVFRIAISNSRLERLEDGHVTFNYRDNRTQQLQHPQLPAAEFIHRFLQHVLPKGFVKVPFLRLMGSQQQRQTKHRAGFSKNHPSRESLCRSQCVPTELRAASLADLSPLQNRPPPPDRQPPPTTHPRAMITPPLPSPSIRHAFQHLQTRLTRTALCHEILQLIFVPSECSDGTHALEPTPPSFRVDAQMAEGLRNPA